MPSGLTDKAACSQLEASSMVTVDRGLVEEIDKLVLSAVMETRGRTYSRVQNASLVPAFQNSDLQANASVEIIV